MARKTQKPALKLKKAQKTSKSKKVTIRKKVTPKKRPAVQKKTVTKKSSFKKVIIAQFTEPVQTANFNFDDFLIEEQINYSKEAEQNIIRPVIKELDKLIEGEKLVSNFKELLPQNEVHIKFTNNGKEILKNKSHKSTNSAYLLNLKKKQEQSKFNKPQKSVLKQFFSEAKADRTDKFDSPKEINFNPTFEAPSLLGKKSLLDRLDDFGLNLHNLISKLNIKKVSLSKNKIDKNFINIPAVSKSGKTLNEIKWLMNLKFALNFALVAMLLIAPIRGLFFYKHLLKTKGQVLGVSEIALSELKLGAEAVSKFDWQQAGYSFNNAGTYLDEAESYLEQYNQNLFQIIKVIPVAGKKFESAENLLISGQYLSLAAQNLSAVLSKSQENKSLDLTLTDGLVSIQSGLDEVLINLDKAGLYLTQVDSLVIPDEYREFFVQIQTSLPEFKNNLNKFKNLFGFSLNVLGHNQPMRYLLMFQNPYELRPSGGFFGSYAILDIKKGEIVNLEVPPGGTYDTKGYMTERVISPKPLQLVGSAWSFWDSNWFVDFKTSAKKAEWFLENSGGPTVDGVIAINATLIPEFLKIVGNIEMPEYNKVLTPEDVVLALQHATLFEYDKAENKPKEIITDMAPRLIKSLLSINNDQILPLILTLNKAFKEKEIQLYFSNNDLQQTATEFGWTGDILETDDNYLMVVDSNIAGGKTNAYIESEINHYAYLQDDGSIINTVSITRKHTGNLIDEHDANYVFARANNVSYLKVYVPQGAELLEVTGQVPPEKKLFKDVYENFYEDEYLRKIEGQVITEPLTGTDIYVNEFNKTAFGNWLQVEPGAESTLTISYRLFKNPEAQSNFNKILSSLSKVESYKYSLLIQKQSGAHNVKINSYLFLPNTWQVKWFDNTAESLLKQTERGLEFSASLTTDQYFATVLTK